MSRRANAAWRCTRCHLHLALCMCSTLPRIETKTRLSLIIHRFEDRKPTNTGRLATECLTNATVVVRGHTTDREAPLSWDPATDPVLLFPYEDAAPLTEFRNSARPITLIVPDGNWRQASKVGKRVPGLRSVPRAALPAGLPSRYRLRAEARDDGLSTLEAIARAFGILEGPEVERALERVLTTVVERTLWARGTLSLPDITHPLPEGAKRHDPLSGVRSGVP